MTVTKFENLESDYDRVQNLKAQNLKLESEIKELKKRQMTPLLLENKKLKDEKEALVKLSNKRYDQIASLQVTNSEALRLRDENKKLDHENINYRIRIDKMVKSDEITQSNLGESLRDNERLESVIDTLGASNLKLESQNKDLTNALKSSLSQIAYLFETVKTFDADFFKIKGFNNDSINS